MNSRCGYFKREELYMHIDDIHRCTEPHCFYLLPTRATRNRHSRAPHYHQYNDQSTFREKTLICIYCLIKFPTHHDALKHFQDVHKCPICPEITITYHEKHEEMIVDEMANKK